MTSSSHTSYISGYGIVSPLGNNVEENYESLSLNKSNIVFIEEWSQIDDLQCHLASFCEGYDESVINRKKRRTMSKMSEMMVVACEEALKKANLTKEDINNRRTIIIVGSTTSSVATFEKSMTKFKETNSTRGQLSTSMFKGMNHSISLNLSSHLDFKGQVICVSSACSTSAQAILLGHQLLQAGQCDLVLAGGADECHVSTCVSFDKAKAAVTNYNHSPQEASRPFDSSRTGIVVSEGASMVILENKAQLEKRSHSPLAKVLGGSHSCDGQSLANSSTESIQSNIQNALDNANVDKSDISYINAHATSTVLGDILEAHAIYNIFENRVPVSSFKGNFGHTLAACGALEVILSIEGIKNDTLFGTKNLIEKDENIPNLNLINEKTSSTGRIFLNNNFAMGGQNVSLVIEVEEK